MLQMDCLNESKDKESKISILVVNCHWDNHGDEAAIRAMIDELQLRYPEADIYVQRAKGTFKSFPETDRVRVIPPFPAKQSMVKDFIATITNGSVCLSEGAKVFYGILKDATVVLHAPGGPSIGDIYQPQEIVKLWRLLTVRNKKVPYGFYAPSMGPFEMKGRNVWRRKILKSAAFVCLREEISAKMVEEFVPSVKPVVTLDSAFQHDIDIQKNGELLKADESLSAFIGDGQNVIGFTITDLMWNAMYNSNGKMQEVIHTTVTQFVQYLNSEGYKVLFIPQLFERANDSEYMKKYAIDNCFVMNENYDCYFQQYVISRIKAVVGMRYHSNIFSAKMGTPFVSVSYEQKMRGFMEKAGLMDYCLDVKELSFEALRNKFESMMSNYSDYKEVLMDKKELYKQASSKTTELVCELIEKIK